MRTRVLYGCVISLTRTLMGPRTGWQFVFVYLAHVIGTTDPRSNLRAYRLILFYPFYIMATFYGNEMKTGDVGHGQIQRRGRLFYMPPLHRHAFLLTLVCSVPAPRPGF
ncbi:hypothetical protein BT93_D0155 [Corymbia citriodora subsp. variegata]|nr:hypothetical protein BT93_D0155 [Corymbia citriodora subsp. variegata]